MELWALRCYGKVDESMFYEDINDAKICAEAHVLACPEGPMPWARNIQWHLTDLGVWVSACRGWLNHAVVPVYSKTSDAE